MITHIKTLVIKFGLTKLLVLTLKFSLSQHTHFHTVTHDQSFLFVFSLRISTIRVSEYFCIIIIEFQREDERIAKQLQETLGTY